MNNSKSKTRSQAIAFRLFSLLTLGVVLCLLWIIGFIIFNGAGTLSWNFITQWPEKGMTQGGILPAIVGTLYLMILSTVIAIPIGIMSGIYMSEYAGNGRVVKVIRVMTNNLGSIPSIVFGLFGMSIFVGFFNLGDSLIAASLTLALLSLPLIIRTTEEAMRALPDSLREGSIALGATRLQTIRRVLLPSAMPGIITGIILSLSRISGETAPILFTGVAYFLPKLPQSIYDQVMALPYHLYVVATSGTDVEASRPMAYGTAFILILIVLIMNSLVSFIRYRFGVRHSRK